MSDQHQDNSASHEAHGKTPSGHGALARFSAFYSRERVLLACIVLLALFFAFTAFIVRQYKRTVHRMADEWYAKGETSLKAGQTEAAVNDYRNALVYKPDDATLEFHLAQALAGAGREDEARSYLLSLLQESPGSGSVNLALARVAVHQKNVSDAVRYYHNAIYGVWATDPLTMRWEVRRELCQYLLAQGDIQEAQPDLIALTQDVPLRDTARARIAGDLSLRAGLWNRALAVYRTVLANRRQDPDALAGAGHAAFELGQYAEAINYLNRLPRDKRNAPPVARMRQTAMQVLALDPFGPRLSVSQKARRTTQALAIAEKRLSACAKERGQSLTTTPPTTDLQKLAATRQSSKRTWSELNLTRHPDRIPAAMSFVFDVETTSSKECGAPTASSDQALALIARRTAGTNQ